MNLHALPAGKDAPRDINVFIEIPHGSSVKYEIDYDSGCLFADRFLHTQMTYPANYGFIPSTKSGDGDAVDCLVVTESPLLPASVIRCRPIGVLKMEDESGTDEKLIAVPHDKVNPYFKNVKSWEDLPEILTKKIEHFFTHYKDLEPNKWVKVLGWGGPDEAMTFIEEGLQRVNG